jgi:hypothetical protein
LRLGQWTGFPCTRPRRAIIDLLPVGTMHQHPNAWGAGLIPRGLAQGNRGGFVLTFLMGRGKRLFSVPALRAFAASSAVFCIPL